MSIDRVIGSLYKTPHRVSTAVLFTIHGALAFTQASMGNNYAAEKYEQFLEHPLIAALEISVPYIVTYAVNTGGRYISKKQS